MATQDRIDLVEEYFDTNARSWSDLYSKAERANDVVLRDRKDAAVSFLAERLPAGARVLDAGCGAGLASVDLIERGFFVHGVDVADKMIAHCRENFAQRGLPAESYELTHGDVLNAGFEDESFDAVSALGFIQYQDDEVASLRELRRILKPGGLLFVSGPVKTRISNWFGFAGFYKRVRWGATLPKGHEVLSTISDHYYTPGRMKYLLREAGFDVLECRGHGYVNFAFIGGRLGFKGELGLHRTLTGAAKILPLSRFANDMMAFARRP
jgi:SAM-dependent methyltransferase